MLSAVIGILTERFVLHRLTRLAERTKWKADDIIFSSLKNILFLISVIIGVIIALMVTDINREYVKVLDKILVILLILTLTIFLKRMAERLVRNYTQTDSSASTPSILANIVKIAIYILGFLIILQSLGFSITPIITALGIGGLAVALALQSTLSNLFSGLYLVMSRHVKTGDYVKLDSGEEGYVTDITWRNATIKELPGNIIVIPNSKLAEAIVKNYQLPIAEMNILIEVGVHYDSDLEHVEKVTNEVALIMQQTHPNGVKEFIPFTRFHTFADSSINFTVYMRVNDFYSHIEFQHEFIKNLHKRFNDEGIEIPYPIRNVYMRN